MVACGLWAVPPPLVPRRFPRLQPADPGMLIIDSQGDPGLLLILQGLVVDSRWRRCIHVEARGFRGIFFSILRLQGKACSSRLSCKFSILDCLCVYLILSLIATHDHGHGLSIWSFSSFLLSFYLVDRLHDLLNFMEPPDMNGTLLLQPTARPLWRNTADERSTSPTTSTGG